jgi:hypothetical protein
VKGKKKNEGLIGVYFFFLAFLSSFFGALATALTSKLLIAPFYI